MKRVFSDNFIISVNYYLDFVLGAKIKSGVEKVISGEHLFLILDECKSLFGEIEFFERFDGGIHILVC
jgi:hypothetical protein